MKSEKPSLKLFLADTLRALKIVSYNRLLELSIEYGAKVSTAERRLRSDSRDAWNIPVEKLNNKKKLIKPGEAIAFYKYIGSGTVLRD